MSLTVNKRERIKYYIMEKIFRGQDNIIGRASEAFGISKQTVYKYVKELIQCGAVEKIGNGNYVLAQTVDATFRYDLQAEKLEEDTIYNETLKTYIQNMNENVVKIWQYSFTEMVNNAIDHADGCELSIYIRQNALYTWVNIVDNGVGIFQKIAGYYDYRSLDDAILSLFKGKLTTDKENHSGEGIFFTSKVMDHFAAISSDKMFSQNNTYETINDLETQSKGIGKLKGKPGTVIIMSLANNVNRTLREVFDMYSTVDGGFDTTSIPMRQICDGGYPVSRSQAKRLYFGFEKFKKVILDFSGVEDMGQGFAHELFCVFKRKHPEIILECINTNENVDKMLQHVIGED